MTDPGLTAAITALLMPHLILAPIALPLFTAAVMLLLPEQHQRIKAALNIGSTLLGLVLAWLLLAHSDAPGMQPGPWAYLPGNWPAPFGIVLVSDRLSAMMLVLTGMVALAAVLFAAARWHRAGVHFHPLFQFQLMGLAGTFLTADLFNLFVFFEITLAASYGLLLHGSGRPRVSAGLHFIALNLAASALFLIGVSMLYGITGTLNMADLAHSMAGIAAPDRGLLHAAAGILAVAFLLKAAVWPLNFWLVPAYSAATAPVGALFALMTKVGVYSLLRLWTLLFGAEAGASAHFGSQWLIAGGMLTLAFGAIGMLGAQRLGHLAGFGAIVSSGTLLAALGFGQHRLTAGLLYYLPGSTLAVSALFLLSDLIDRWRNAGANLAPHAQSDDAPFLSADLHPTEGLNLDDQEQALIGQVIPAAAALLGLAFMACTLTIAGLPPLPGFIAKFAMIDALLNPQGLGASRAALPGVAGWVLIVLLPSSGLLALLALMRAGMRHFWAAQGRSAPRLLVLEALPIALLLLACAALVWQAGAVLRFTQATADALHAPASYLRAVLSATPVPNPPRHDAERTVP
ncbi:monovalent cation/H+ antiporter subunit D [Verminephrobacter eiseniae]|uniref:monovalent cation/H+ antiporter subunit D n=1 Tax=Verminephrobacter eiseniae TaxID=364317 RepID=UPI002238E986|nr:monovalent cation/H+ antiporter subunit D [Verminephrobacter eiseniae]MCW5231653.1 monovalent cation/H+ antiporter subunit D [Verminephrobacter eiseniae]MCW5293384.1 monovalent cation/H+ antiporter subunit D [Verminephrobacter eiseniae]MCW8186299.1 monovalent cation/H+ antiporter subunit D [Verminephrobacter eiseniae]MCW8224790.1 monovalent cation/H+ antiporter subunit D [Verminephrobacter eiseniae]MCW8236772.1 monovalent cation/H+ antiporter subunit D [Verminephrobacter eiseniae]